VPVIRIITSATVDEQMYEMLNTVIDIEHQHPEGMLMHAVGEVDGRWQIVNVWEANEYADQFDREILEPTVRGLTGEPLHGRQVTSYEVRHLVTP